MSCTSSNIAPVTFIPSPVRQGLTFIMRINIYQCGTDDVAVDLSGMTVTGQIGATGDVQASLTQGANVVFEGSNTIAIIIAADDTATWRPGRHPFYIDLTTIQGKVIEIARGYLPVKPKLRAV